METAIRTKAKYFDYLPKYGNKLESFLGIPNLADGINTYRTIVHQIPNEVAIGTRRLSEVAARNIASNSGIIHQDMKYVDVLRELKNNKIITPKISDLFHKIRKNGNIAAHENGIIPVSEAVESLATLDTLFRVFTLNLFKDESINPESEISDQMFITTYNTFDRKLIYVQSVKDTDGTWKMYHGLEKIGDASVPENYEADLRPNSEYLREHATKRIKQYMTTAGVPFVLHWAQLAVNNENKFFRDHDVHAVLKRSGYKPKSIGIDDSGRANEWFNVTVDIAKDAIQAVKDGKASLSPKIDEFKEYRINFRPEQRVAIEKTKEIFKNKDEMLWNAKMRFGKTLSALQLIKESGYKKVLIMTHRPVVSDGWYEDFNKIFTDGSYIYGSRTQGEKIQNLIGTEQAFVYFASIQDLRGSEWAGGKHGEKNYEFLSIEWDLIIIDEAHEGNDTQLANNVKDKLKNPDTKILELSGTPFNLFDKYDEDNIFTWDYTMEQEAKARWAVERPDEPNPYEGLPKVSMYTFEIPNKFDYFDDNKAFNFREFFRVREDNENKLLHETDVRKFLDYITTSNAETNFPFSKPEFRENLRHTLWLMPGVKEANAFEQVLATHSVFKEYNIANVVKTGDSEHASESDLELVRNAIGSNPAQSKTITLTVRKLTTGVNVPEWTGVFFLSNTESPTSYLQAAFRAQTPFNHAELGVKKNCYIFDFAPDRALKIMSESVGLTSKKGKVNTLEQKKKLEHMLNFFPILGQQGNVMKEFSVDRMLTALKKAYAEKAVRSGFEDTSLYNDNLLNLDQADLSKFEKLKEIVGSSKRTTEKDFIVSENGMDEEEYEKASNSENKQKRQRTPEEQEAIDRAKKLREQRAKMISILRGVSIRIPMMIYGMDIDIKEDITIENFINLVDEQSWNEFMPSELTKEDFKDFTKYYDGEVFIEAGRIIRHKAKSYDELDVIDRAAKISELFATFKNPDKETVLTPWRVVNLHTIKTLGGLSFYDDEFKNMTVDGQPVYRWVENKITSEVYGKNTTFLDINSKTGLYPLFVAISLYQSRLEELSNEKAGKFDGRELTEIWKTILKENIFAIAKTPMAKTITERTLKGYLNFDTNIKYIPGIVESIKQSPDEAKEIIEGEFNSMKFDIICGNPPFQDTVAKKETNNGQKRVTNIFQHFQIEADKLAEKYVTLIYPAGRWIHRTGKGLSNFGLEQMNDPKLSELIVYGNANEIFPDVGIADGISIVLKDMKKTSEQFKYRYIIGDTDEEIMMSHPGKELMPLVPGDIGIVKKIDDFVSDNQIDYIGNSKVINQKLFRIESDFAEQNPDKVKLYDGGEFDTNKYIKLFTNDKAGKAGRSTWFLAHKNVIQHNAHLISEWQVVVSSANAGGQKRDNQIAVVDNHSAFGRSRLALKSFKSEKEAENFLKYAQSKLIRFAFLMTDESLSSLGMKVPDILDYTDQSKFIDFEKNIDDQLFELLNLTDKEQLYIQTRLDSIRGA